MIVRSVRRVFPVEYGFVATYRKKMKSSSRMGADIHNLDRFSNPNSFNMRKSPCMLRVRRLCRACMDLESNFVSKSASSSRDNGLVDFLMRYDNSDDSSDRIVRVMSSKFGRCHNASRRRTYVSQASVFDEAEYSKDLVYSV